MNYCCSSISAFIFIVHVSIAAPPFDELYLLFDELSEMNTRMGETIKKAKDMTQVIDLKTSVDERDSMHTIDVAEEGYHKMAHAAEQMNKYDLDGSLDDDTDHNVTQHTHDWGAYDADARLKQPIAVGQVNPAINSTEHSFVNDALNFTANQWNNWTGASNQENVTDNKDVTEKYNRGEFDEFDDEQNEDQNLNKNEDNTDENTDQWDDNTNQQYEKELNSQPIDVIEDQIDYANKTANDDSFGNDTDHSHDNDREVNVEKNYNGDEIAEESDSWFGRAIDSVVSWFN